MADIKKTAVINVDTGNSTKDVNELTGGIQELNKALTGNDGAVEQYNKSLQSITDANEKVEASQLSMTDKFANFSRIAAGVVGGVEIITNSFTALGLSQETADELAQSATQLLGIVQGFEAIADAAESFKTLTSAQQANTAVTKASAAATELQDKANKKVIISSKLVKKALLATGIGALVVAVGALIANWDNLTAAFGRSTSKIKDNSDALKQLEMDMNAANNAASIMGLGIADAYKVSAEGLKELIAKYNAEFNKYLSKDDLTDAEMERMREISSKLNELYDKQYMDMKTYHAQEKAAVQEGLSIGVSAREQEIAAVKKTYEDKIKLAKNNYKAVANFRTQMQNEIKDINKRYDDEERQRYISDKISLYDHELKLKELTAAKEGKVDWKYTKEGYKEYKNYFKKKKELYKGDKEELRKIKEEELQFEIDTDNHIKTTNEELFNDKIELMEAELEMERTIKGEIWAMSDESLEHEKDIIKEKMKAYKEGSAEYLALQTQLLNIDKQISDNKLTLAEETSATDLQIARDNFESKKENQGLEFELSTEGYNLTIKNLDDQMAKFNENSNEYRKLANDRKLLGERLVAETGAVIDEEGNILKEGVQNTKDAEEAKSDIVQGSMAVLQATMGGIAAILDEAADAEGVSVKKKKQMQIASATINTLTGALAAFNGITASTAGWGIALAAIQAGVVLTTGFMQIAKMRKIDPETGNGTDGAGGKMDVQQISPEAIMAGAKSNMLKAAEVQGAQTEKLAKDSRVYVTESDIKNTEKKVKVAESESTY